MKDLTRKIIAIIGLVCMGCFIVAMLISFFAPTAVYGRIGYIAVAFLIVALVAFALIYFDNKERRQQQEAQQAEKQRRAENKKKREENALRQAELNKQRADAAEKVSDNGALPDTASGDETSGTTGSSTPTQEGKDQNGGAE